MGVFDELLVVPAAEPIIDCTGTPDKAAVAFVEGELKGRGESHGLGHTPRVRHLSLEIWDAGNPFTEAFNQCADAGMDPMRVVEFAALLHDVCDHKYVDAATASGAAAIARRDAFLAAHASAAEADACVRIIAEVSYSREAKALRRRQKPGWRALEEPLRTLRHVVSDADKLDAIGPAGLRRCIEYRHESAAPGASLDARAVVEDVAVHCDEKLLLLAPEFIHTAGGKALAKSEHDFLARWRERARAALGGAPAATTDKPPQPRATAVA